MSFTLNPFTGNWDIVHNSSYEFLTGTISAGTSQSVDSIPLVDFNFADYVIFAKNSSDDESKTMRLLVFREGSSICETPSAIMGSLSIGVTAQVVTTNYDLTIDNPGAEDIEYIILRAAL